MKAIVEKNKLIELIKREFPFYTEQQIKDTIEEYGAEYFNNWGSDLSIKYCGFGKWEITI